MRHWPSRGQEKREGDAIPALSVAVADWGGAVPGVGCSPLSAARWVRRDGRLSLTAAV
jgi:hypothetical protein